MNVDITINIILGVMIAAYVAFLALYMSRFPWRSSFQGRTLVGQKFILATLALFFLIESLVTHDADGWNLRNTILVIILALLAYHAVATFVGLTVLYRKTLQKFRRDHRTPTE